MENDPVEITKVDESVTVDNPLKALLPRQRRFLKQFLVTQNRTDAWMKVYRCKSRESALVPEVVDWLYQLSGLSDDDFAEVVRNGMKATKIQLYLGKKYEEADHYARFKAVELGLKMRGKDTPKVGNQMNIQIINDATHGVFRIVENVNE
jgi:hypothetical protein